MITARRYDKQPIAKFSDVVYVQNGVRLNAKEARALKNASSDELARTEYAAELQAELESFKAAMAKQGRQLHGAIVFKLSEDRSGNVWLNGQLFREPRPTTEATVAQLCAMPL